MESFFDITSQDIAVLTDADLRELIGLLCEAECRSQGLGTKGIRWGGNQDEEDGGIDVMVKVEKRPVSNNFIPAKVTGFQVKKPGMKPSDITKEMSPKGPLRPLIQDIIKKGGAYIIISSGENCTEIKYKNRLESMATALEGLNVEDGQFDFYDRSQVASWVRHHPSLVLWVRQKVGRQVQGWYPYQSWSYRGDTDNGYILDEELKLNFIDQKDTSYEIKEGIDKIIEIVMASRASVRLTGLSGVGKTRLVEALFDPSVTDKALNPHQVVYTDMSYSPDPPPRALAEYFVQDGRHIFFIVDNCTRELHSELTKVCRTRGSKLRLFTIEYDVRDNLPQETNVFHLEPSSDSLIQTLLERRFPHISQVNISRLAEASGGNARLAIALAATINVGETLSGFSDQELFERLFHQRNQPDQDLIDSAMALSVIYSFDGEDVSASTSELAVLGSLIDKSPRQLYKDVAELRERSLVQSRSHWRAVLPHALANFLAKKALREIPSSHIVEALFKSGSERLIRSFTRRLNYLHDNEEARKIVRDWLAPGGWLSQVDQFNRFGIEIFENVAPILPEDTLAAIERVIEDNEVAASFFVRGGKYSENIVRILRLIAFEIKFFERATKLIIRYALTEKQGENHNSIRGRLASMFTIFLSGTMAGPELRLKALMPLLLSDKTQENILGIECYKQTLQTGSFSNVYGFEFGMRPRSYGYKPETHELRIQWWLTFLKFPLETELSQEVVQSFKDVIGVHFKTFWPSKDLRLIMNGLVQKFTNDSSWASAWGSCIRYWNKNFDSLTPEDKEELKEIIARLEPKSLSDRIYAYVLDPYRGHDFIFNEAGTLDTMEREKMLDEITYNLGIELASDHQIFEELLPEITNKQGQRSFHLGRGLAEGVSDVKAHWQRFMSHLGENPLQDLHTAFPRGFMYECNETNPDLVDTWLEEMGKDEVLKQYLMIFESTIDLEQSAKKRLFRHVKDDGIKVKSFQHLAYGKTHQAMSDNELSRFIQLLLLRDGGIYVACEILNMRFHAINEEASSIIKDVGALVLEQFPMANTSIRNTDRWDHDLGNIAIGSLRDARHESTVLRICKSLRVFFEDRLMSVLDYPDYLSALCEAHPLAFLDGLLLDDEGQASRPARLRFGTTLRISPLNAISFETLITWIDNSPEDRYPVISSLLDNFIKDEKSNLQWSTTIIKLIEREKYLDLIFPEIKSTLMPWSYSGSAVVMLENRKDVVRELYKYNTPQIRQGADEIMSHLEDKIAWYHEIELSESQNKNESFE